MKNPSFKISNAIPGVGASLKVLATATAIGMIILAGSAQAKSSDRSCTTVPKEQWLSMQELQDKVKALGYDVKKAKLEKGCAEFDIRDKDGSKIELYVDLSNGQIVRQKAKKTATTPVDAGSGQAAGQRQNTEKQVPVPTDPGNSQPVEQSPGGAR